MRNFILFIHPLSDVQSIKIGANTKVWQFCVVLTNAEIGTNCNICSHVFIENDVRIGNNVTIKCGVQIWDGITLEDNVFIGPNVTFCNDKFPKSGNKEFEIGKVLVKQGASIGANATILPNITIGKNSLIAAGSIVTNVITRLRSFKNDWFLDSEANIDWIGILGARNNKTAILSEVERVVLNTKGVTKITSLTSTLKSQRGIQINVKFVTVYNNEFEIIEEV